MLTSTCKNYENNDTSFNVLELQGNIAKLHCKHFFLKIKCCAMAVSDFENLHTNVKYFLLRSM